MNPASGLAQAIADWKSQGIGKADMMINVAEYKIGYPYAWGATGQKCTVANRKARMNNSKISDGDKNLIKKRCQVLNGSKASCEGCKYYVNGGCSLLHDCIDFVNSLLEAAGIPHYGAGCSTMWNHANNWDQKGKLSEMPETPCLVFQWYPGNEKKMQHIGFYDGKGNVYHCSVEVKKQKLSEYPWSHYAIPKGMGGDVPVTHKTIKRGSSGDDVILCQGYLMRLGYDLSPYNADGKFGAKTETAVKAFQGSAGLKQDGIVGRDTWAALQKAIDDLNPEPQPEPVPPATVLYTATIRKLTRERVENLVNVYPAGPIYALSIPHLTSDEVEELREIYDDVEITEESEG